MSSRDALRNACKAKVGFLEVDGEKVYMRALTGKGRFIYTQLHQEAKAAEKVVQSHVIAALGICDETGQLLYQYDDPGDLEELLEFDAVVLDKLAVTLFGLSGLTKEAQEEAEKK